MDIARLQQQPQQRQQPQSNLRQRPVTVWKHKRGARLHILCRHQPSALHAYQPFTEHIAGPLPLVQRQPRHMGFLQVAMGRPLRDKHKRHIQSGKTKRQPHHDTSTSSFKEATSSRSLQATISTIVSTASADDGQTLPQACSMSCRQHATRCFLPSISTTASTMPTSNAHTPRKPCSTSTTGATRCLRACSCR